MLYVHVPERLHIIDLPLSAAQLACGTGAAVVGLGVGGTVGTGARVGTGRWPLWHVGSGEGRAPRQLAHSP